MAIVRQYHKDTDTTYVYESVSYWDAEKGQSRSKRRVIGKVDPVTGEIIPTGKRGRKKKGSSDQSGETPAAAVRSGNDTDQQKILELELTIYSLNDRISDLESELGRYKSVVEKIRTMSGKISSLCRELPQE